MDFSPIAGVMLRRHFVLLHSALLRHKFVSRGVIESSPLSLNNVMFHVVRPCWTVKDVMITRRSGPTNLQPISAPSGARYGHINQRHSRWYS